MTALQEYVFGFCISRVKKFSDFFYIAQYQTSANYFCVSSLIISSGRLCNKRLEMEEIFSSRENLFRICPREVGLHA